jgi:anti-sigma factor RsiW
LLPEAIEMNSNLCSHLSKDLILRSLDDELTTAERFECESHLAMCQDCRLKLASMHNLSMDIETAVHAVGVPDMTGVRGNLQRSLQSPPVVAAPSQGTVLRRFGWGMGIAATLAMGILLAPRVHLPAGPPALVTSQKLAAHEPAALIEIDGEIFQPVPYANADLPTSAPHIIQMRVPISSLAEAGIVLEPVNAIAGTDTERSVLADVLVGADGQPRGVHVLEFY